MPALIGTQIEGTTGDFAAAGHALAYPFVAGGSGTVIKMFCRTKVANATLAGVRLAVYDNGAGVPGNRLAMGSVSGGDPTGTGLFSADIAAVNIVSGTTYWLALSGTGEQLDVQGTTAANVGKEASADMPDPWTNIGNMQVRWEIWAETADGERFQMNAMDAQPGAYQPGLPESQGYTDQGPNPVASGTTFQQALDATVVVITATLQKQVNKTLLATSTITATLQKQVNKILTASTVTITATLQKQINKTLSATSTILATLLTSKAIQVALNATTTITATLQKQVNKNMTANATITATLQKQVNKTLAATSTITATLQKRVEKVLTSNTVITATLLTSKTVNVALNATVNITATLVTQFIAGGGAAVRRLRQMMGMGQ